MSIFIFRDKRDEFSIHYIGDDAIDQEKSDTDQYTATGDASHLVFREGRLPAKFIFRPLSHRMSRELTRIYLSAGDGDGENALAGLDALELMFYGGLIRVENVNEMPPKVQELLDNRGRDGTSKELVDYFDIDVVNSVASAAINVSMNNKKK